MSTVLSRKPWYESVEKVVMEAIATPYFEWRYTTWAADQIIFSTFKLKKKMHEVKFHKRHDSFHLFIIPISTCNSHASLESKTFSHWFKRIQGNENVKNDRAEVDSIQQRLKHIIYNWPERFWFNVMFVPAMDLQVGPF